MAATHITVEASPTEQTPVLIIGGGISGLSTAWFLHQQGIPVTLLESRSRCGGNVLTSREQGYLFEHGPNSCLQKPGNSEDALGRLIDGLGLKEHRQTAPRQAERRYIVRNGQLALLPSSPVAFFTTPVFSWPAKLRLLAEPLIGRATAEESIASFVRRRLGQEFLDYAIEPFISGVYAGNPQMLSIQAAIPKIYALERDHGSLIRGAIALGKTRKAGMPRGAMVSFAEGMEQLPRTLAERLPKGTITTNAQVVRLEREPAGWVAHWQDGSTCGRTQAQQVVLAVPAPVAGKLLDPISDGVARLLRAIPYAPIASLAIGFRRDQVRHPLDGFGFLIPRREHIHTLGALFSSTLFPGRAPEAKVLLTAFIGGALHPEILERSDHDLAEVVLRELSRLLGIQEGWDFLQLTRYTGAIPQYTLGHLERMAELDRRCQQLPQLAGLHFRANWRDGIAVVDCIRNAERLALALGSRLREEPS